MKKNWFDRIIDFQLDFEDEHGIAALFSLNFFCIALVALVVVGLSLVFPNAMTIGAGIVVLGLLLHGPFLLVRDLIRAKKKGGR